MDPFCWAGELMVDRGERSVSCGGVYCAAFESGCYA